MKENSKKIDILNPIDQMSLFGYKKYFNTLNILYKKNILPNAILLTGPKGIGKSTFAYHFINYLLSQSEDMNYSIENYSINEENKSYQLLKSFIHPNFHLIDNFEDEQIKIDQIRNFFKFNNKSAYLKNLKIVLLDNAEFLNTNSANALLKVLEEPSNNTFFFIIHNSNTKILNTIISRCIQFKINFNIAEKKEIFENLIKHYNFNYSENDFNNYACYETPGNILKLFSVFQYYNINNSKDSLDNILFLIDIYKNSNDHNFLNYISFLIEDFYKNLSLNNNNMSLYYNKNKISNLIHNTKKYNLDKKNLLISITRILKNEYSFS